MEKEFTEILGRFCASLKTQFCFAREEYLENFIPPWENGTEEADSRTEKARQTLRANNIPLSYWDGFVKTGNIAILEEVPAKTAAAIAIAIRLFLSPHAEITLGFNCDKYDRLSIDFYWTLSDEYPMGYIDSNVD